MRSTKALFIAAAYLLVTQLVASVRGEPPNFKEISFSCHRLPVNVRPNKYDLRLNFTSLDSDDYEGSVDITVDFLNRERSDAILSSWDLARNSCRKSYDENRVVLHADKNLEIQRIEVSSGSYLSFIAKPVEVSHFERDNATQMIAFRIRRGEYATKHGSWGKIKITFKGRMRSDKRGVYLSTYNDGQQVFKHIVSQFQPTDARTVFPAFDEPRFRTPFSLRLTHPEGLTAYGNTQVKKATSKEGLTTTRFVTTPNMPVHMVAFTIGQFDEPLEAVSLRTQNKRGRDIKIRVITAPGKRATGEFGLEVATKSLEWFERYIDYDFPLEKLDVIAIADHDKDNTESWGLVFVRDNLVWIDDETKQDTRITTAVNIAHVVVHQWFGNLISAEWWDDLWITEGVAAQFAFKFVQQNYDFQSKFFVRLGPLTSVLQADQAGNLHPLSPAEENLVTSEQIYGIFDNLEFMKSGSMAQMVEESDGSSRYQKILRGLIKEHAYETINFKDYAHAVYVFNDHPVQMYDFVWEFRYYVGVPVITSRIGFKKDEDLALTPFFDKHETFWAAKHLREQKITINVNTVFNKAGCIEPSWTGLMDNKNSFRLKSRLPGWFDLEDPRSDHSIKIDNEPSIATYYRTFYSDQLYERLETAIKKHFIGPMDRLQILDDANSLVQAKWIETERFESLLNSYANEDHPAVVLAILTATNTYRGLAPEDSSSLPSEQAIWSIFKNYGFTVLDKEEVIMQRARQVVLTTLIKQGEEEVIRDAVKAFEEAQGKVALFLREPVYTAVVLSRSKHVNRLLSHLSETKSYEEKLRLVTALTLSKDQEVLAKVKSWLESSGLKAETTKPFLEAISAALSQ